MLFFAKKETGSRNKTGERFEWSTWAARCRTNQFTVFTASLCTKLTRLEDLPCDYDDQYIRVTTTFGTRSVPLRHAFALIYDYGGGLVSLDAGLPN